MGLAAPAGRFSRPYNNHHEIRWPRVRGYFDTPEMDRRRAGGRLPGGVLPREKRYRQYRDCYLRTSGPRERYRDR